jgi:hypothetical protein
MFDWSIVHFRGTPVEPYIQDWSTHQALHQATTSTKGPELLLFLSGQHPQAVGKGKECKGQGRQEPRRGIPDLIGGAAWKILVTILVNIPRKSPVEKYTWNNYKPVLDLRT